MGRIEATSRCPALCQHQEVIRAIEPAVADNLRLLVPIDKAWQPTRNEARHEAFYTRMMAEVLEHDPASGILAFRAMLRGRIAMPAGSWTTAGIPICSITSPSIAHCVMFVPARQS